MLKISIPKPCHQDWDKMLPQQQGRFCNSCAKTVVDFTTMNDEEVKNYFLKNAEEKTCGRFTNTQVHRITINLPENILYISMPLWKRFLAASLIIFSTTLFSCDTNYDVTTGLIDVQATHSSISDTSPVKINEPRLIGKIKMEDTIPVKKVCTQTMGIIKPPVTRELMGDIIIVPEKKDTAKIITGTSVMVTPEILKGETVVKPKNNTVKIKKDTSIIVGEPAVNQCDKNIYQ